MLGSIATAHMTGQQSYCDAYEKSFKTTLFEFVISNKQCIKDIDKSHKMAAEIAAESNAVFTAEKGNLIVKSRNNINLNLADVPSHAMEPTAIAFVSWVIGAHDIKDTKNDGIWIKLEEFLERIKASWNC